MIQRGLAAEYRSVDALLVAIRVLRARRITALEAYTPYPMHEVDDALGARRSRLAIAAGIGGLLGAAAGYGLQWLLVAYLYPVDAGGRPPHMPQPFVIIAIEMGFLLGGLSVFVAYFVASRLFKLWEPIFEVPNFESATRAGFWLAISANDPRWDRYTLEHVLHGTGPEQVHTFGGIA